MRSGALTAQPFVQGRGALGPVLAASGAILALALAMIVVGLAEAEPVHAVPGRGHRECATVFSGAGAREQQHPRLKPQLAALSEWAALASSSPTTSLHQQMLTARGRARV